MIDENDSFLEGSSSECSIVDKWFMSLGIEEYEKQGDPEGVSWPKLDACRRTCHHYSVPIHHIHARTGRILAILVNKWVNCWYWLFRCWRWIEMMTWKSMMMSLITYWRRSSCLHHWTSCLTFHSSLSISVFSPSLFSEATVEVVSDVCTWFGTAPKGSHWRQEAEEDEDEDDVQVALNMDSILTEMAPQFPAAAPININIAKRTGVALTTEGQCSRHWRNIQ